jgi:hypothetical protein
MKHGKAAGDLPGATKRGSLGTLVWQAVQEVVAYSKAEDVAKEAEARLLALRVANSLRRAELGILKREVNGVKKEVPHGAAIDLGTTCVLGAQANESF